MPILTFIFFYFDISCDGCDRIRDLCVPGCDSNEGTHFEKSNSGSSFRNCVAGIMPLPPCSWRCGGYDAVVGK